MSIRPAALSILLLVAACGQAQPKEDPADPYAGLEHEILKWRAEIEAGVGVTGGGRAALTAGGEEKGGQTGGGDRSDHVALRGNRRSA